MQFFLYSGSPLLSSVLSCLLQITHNIAQDAAPENAQLLQYVQSSQQQQNQRSVVSNTKSTKTSTSESQAAFASLLARAHTTAKEGEVSDGVGPVSESGSLPAVAVAVAGYGDDVNATDVALAEGFRTVQEYVQWRVQLLQRIQLPLAVAYR